MTSYGISGGSSNLICDGVQPSCSIKITSAFVTERDSIEGTWEGDQDSAAAAASSYICRHHGLTVDESDVEVHEDGTWFLPPYVDGD